MTTSTDAALDLQLDMLSWLETDYGMRYAQGLIADRYGDDNGMPGRRANITKAEDVGFAMHSRILMTGDTFAVSEEIVDVLEFASATIPDYELHIHDLPTDCGFVVLDRVMLIPDTYGKPLAVKALGWMPAAEGKMDVLFAEEDAVAEMTTGVVLILWTDPSDPRDHLHDEWLNKTDGLLHRKGYAEIAPPHGLFSMFGGLWPFGKPPTDPLYKTLMAFFRFVQEPWVDPRMVTPSRHARRRALRKKVEPKVHVVQLRKKEGAHHVPSGEPGTDFVEWSCRWLVRGHWRNQWYPSIAAHRPKWIPEHIKGPEDRPLVIHDTVFRVDR